MSVVVFPAPCSTGGATMVSNMVVLPNSLSRTSASPVSTNCRTPSDTTEPTLKRGEEGVAGCEKPEIETENNKPDKTLMDDNLVLCAAKFIYLLLPTN